MHLDFQPERLLDGSLGLQKKFATEQELEQQRCFPLLLNLADGLLQHVLLRNATWHCLKALDRLLL